MTNRKTPSTMLGVWLAFSLAFANVSFSADRNEGGSIEGRVSNLATGGYLTRARVTLPANGGEQFTDQFGQYRFVSVPAGETTIRVFYTGLEIAEQKVTVVPGRTLQQDFKLESGDNRGARVEKMDAFVVAAGELNGAALAINEQRFSPNIKNVASTDEFGEITTGDITEFTKFMPNVGLNGAIRGLPNTMTLVTVDGNRLASAANGNETRAVEFDQLLLSNVSRIEVTKVPTPDSPADSIAGTINLVSKSAFEREKAELSYRTYLSWNVGDAFTFKKTPGEEGYTRKVRTSANASWIVPLNKKLGFTLTLSNLDMPGLQHFRQYDWVPTTSVPATSTQTTADRPYLKSFQTRDSPRRTIRGSAGVTVDYRVSPYDVVSVSMAYTQKILPAVFHPVTFDVGPLVTSFSRSHTQGAAGRGVVNITTQQLLSEGKGFQPNLSYRHNGKIWKFDAAASYSRSWAELPDASAIKSMAAASIQLANVTVRLDNIDKINPDPTLTSATGAPIDPYNINNYRITSTNTAPREGTDVYRSLRFNLGRDLRTRIPLTAKIGGDFRENTRDINQFTRAYNFVGRDGVANTADDGAGVLFDEVFSKRVSPFNFPQLLQYPSPYKLYDLFVEHPEYFRINDVRNLWRNPVNASKWLRETVTAGYFRLDTRLLNNRWWLVGGVRYERTDDDGYGPLINPKLVPKGTTDPLLIDQYTYSRRGAHSRRIYGDFYPSLNSAFNVTENTIFRAGYARTIGRPNFSNIIPGATLPDPDSTSRVITLRNAALKPWQANNFDLLLEHYFSKTGNVAVGVFRKDITDFFDSTTAVAAPELLEPYGIDPDVFSAANGYMITTERNVGAARIDGFEVSYKQALTFLPQWASGIQVYGSFTKNNISGSHAVEFGAYTPRQYSMGFSLTRRKYSLTANMSSVAGYKPTVLTGTGIPADTYSYNFGPQVYNGSACYTFSKHVQLFFSVRNAGSRNRVQNRYSPGTPEYARFFSQTLTPAIYSAGIKGAF